MAGAITSRHGIAPPTGRGAGAPAARGGPAADDAAPSSLTGADGHAALRQLASEVSGKADLAHVFADILDQSVALFGADMIGVWTVEPGDRPFRLAAHRGLSASFMATVESIPRGSRAAGIRAIESRRTEVLREPTRKGTTAELRAAYRAEGIRTACFVPIVFLEEPLAILVLYHRSRREWHAEDVDLVEAFAAQAAVALQNARLHSSVEGFAARLDAIKDLAAELNHIHDVDEVGRAIVDQVRELYDSDSARVYTVDWETRMCEPLAFGGIFVGSDHPDPELLRMPVGTGLTGYVAQHDIPLRVADTTRERNRRVVGTDEPESMLFAPMSYGDTVLGVVVVSKKGVDRYSADDLTTLSIFAGFAALAFVNARNIGQLRAQQEELERRLASQRLLLEVNETLLAARDPDAVFERIADALISVVHHDSLTIYRLDRERGVRVAVLARDKWAKEILADEQPLDVGLTGWAIGSGEMVVANAAHLDPRAATVPGTPEEPEALVVVPLRAQGVVIGTLNVSRWGSAPDAFSGDEIELISLFAGQASVAVQAVEARHAAEVRAERDALTGALNHGAFQADLARYLEPPDASSLPEPFALLMLDLDGFKVYNDGLGHPAGDRFLITVADALTSAVRTESADRIYRYGGDEFAALLPGLGRAEARAVADRLEAEVAALGAGRSGPQVTISVGVATFPEDGRTRDELVMNADAELYLEKAARRQSRPAPGEGPGMRDGAEYLASLQESTYALLARRDPSELLETIVARAAALVDSSSGYLYVVDQEADVLRVAVGLGIFSGWDGFELHRGEGLAGRIWDSGEPMIVDDYRSWSGRAAALDGRAIGSIIGVPMTAGREIVGVIGVAAGSDERAFQPEDAAAIGRFAQLASVALENARLHAAARAEIAARTRSEEELRAGSERLRRLADASFEALVIHRDGRILEVNRAFVDLFGRSPASVAGLPVLGLFPESERQSIERSLEVDTDLPVETTVLLADGTLAPVELIGRTIATADEGATRATAIRDIRERRAIEERLTRQALYDALTGLPNRSLFLDRVTQALAWERQDGGPHVAVLVVDLDRFKAINESFGHAVGDQILAAAGRRFEDVIRPGDTIARLGGDEYAVLVTGGGVEAARSVAERLVDALATPFTAEGRDSYLSSAVGIALATEGTTAAGLLREAAIALDRAKVDPAERIALFVPAMSDVSIDRLALEADLRRALGRDELEAWYQPLVDLRTGRVVGHEALARWRHPTRGLLGPYEFISLAEETGLIIPLGDRILTEACRQTRAWQLAFPSDQPLVVSVNLSARQLTRPDLADSVRAALASSGLSAESLELEITETVAMRDAQASGTTLRVLHDLGVRLALDDFGTGYSSLSYISRLPLDIIKVDRSFVAGLADSTANHSIIAAVSALARGLRVEVTAEGIERQEELEAVVRLGCDRGQGFLFAKPMPAAEAEARLARAHAGE